MSPSELDAFVLHNHWLMTMPEMEEESGETVHYIRKSFRRLGIEPKSPAEIKIKFIQNYRDILTRKQMVKMLDVGYNRFCELCRQANIPLDGFKKEEEKNVVTPRQVLSGFQMGGAGHFDNTQREQDLWDRIVKNIKDA